MNFTISEESKLINLEIFARVIKYLQWLIKNSYFTVFQMTAMKNTSSYTMQTFCNRKNSAPKWLENFSLKNECINPLNQVSGLKTQSIGNKGTESK